MEMRLRSSEPCKSWEDLKALIATVDPKHGLTVVRALTLKEELQVGLCFVGRNPVDPMNIHVLAREWLRMLPESEWPVESLTTEDYHNVVQFILNACCQLNYLHEKGPGAALGLKERPSTYTLGNFLPLWAIHLEQRGMFWSLSHESARAWKLFAEHWPRLEATGRIKSHGGTLSRRDLGTNLMLLLLGVWRNDGVVKDHREFFQHTKLEPREIESIISVAALPLNRFKEEIEKLKPYAHALRRFFVQSGRELCISDLSASWWVMA